MIRLTPNSEKYHIKVTTSYMVTDLQIYKGGLSSLHQQTQSSSTLRVDLVSWL